MKPLDMKQVRFHFSKSQEERRRESERLTEEDQITKSHYLVIEHRWMIKALLPGFKCEDG